VRELDVAALLSTLERHRVRYVVIGGQAAVVQGAPLLTEDLDITPARDRENLKRLAEALRELGAKLRSPTAPEGVGFAIEAELLTTAEIWTLTTRVGDLDLAFSPPGTGGFDDLRRDATRMRLAEDLTVLVASLADVIRSKEAADRDKDRMQLSLLRRTLEEIRAGERGTRPSRRGR
jgi:hypothetical protein